MGFLYKERWYRLRFGKCDVAGLCRRPAFLLETKSITVALLLSTVALRYHIPYPPALFCSDSTEAFFGFSVPMSLPKL